MADKALAGIRVLDFTRFISGPFCGQLLGDFGAEVIKIEKGTGDTTRPFLPFIGDSDVSLYFTGLNRNKKSVKIDYRNPKGIALVKELIKESDIIVENFRPGTMAKMGLDRKQLDEINSDIIVVHISGFGQDGPYKDRAAFDCILEAMSGMMSVTGEENSKPMLMGQAYLDFIAGTFGAMGAITALYNRPTHGGQDVDVSMLEAALAYSLFGPQHYLANGQITGQFGNRDRVLSPANTFLAKDNKYVYIHAGTDQFFARLAKYIGREDVLTEDKLLLAAVRMDHPEVPEALVQEWVSTQTAQEVEDQLTELGIPCAMVANMADLVKNPQLLARNAFREVDYPGGMKVPLVASNMKLSKTPGDIYSRPPLLGEHTESILTEVLGMSADEIRQLKDEKVI